MATTTEQKREYKIIGTRPIRHDGVDKATGRAVFGADVALPGLLHGKVLRSPHLHARVKSIDASRAEAHPDVKAVATAADLAPTGPVAREVVLGQTPSRNILAVDKVLYRGHAIAAVAASSPHAAEQALSLIDVEYEPLSGVTSVEEAMASDSPVLHEHWTDDDHPAGTNIAGKEEHSFGDLSGGFESADLVMEREYRTKTVHQGYIEPQNATAWWSPNDRLTVWCSTQGHFGVRDNTARILGVPISDVKVVATEIGGGFGGKLPVYLEPVAAVLSKKSGRPVKMTMDRGEVLEATGPTSGSYMRIKMGVTNEGRITAADAFVAFEAGAFPGAPVVQAAASVFAPYDIENVHVEAYDVVDNKPKTNGVSRSGSPDRRLRYRKLRRRDRGRTRHRSYRVPSPQRRPPRITQVRRRHEHPHWGRGGDGFGQVSPPLQRAPRREVAWTGRRYGVLSQQLRHDIGGRQRAVERHCQPGGGQRRHRGHAHRAGPARCRGTGHPGRGRHPPGGGH